MVDVQGAEFGRTWHFLKGVFGFGEDDTKRITGRMG